MSDKATPRPWGPAGHSDGDIRSSHTESNGYTSEHIAELSSIHYRPGREQERLANRDLIIRAVNNYDALMAVKAAAEKLAEECLKLPRLPGKVAVLESEFYALRAALVKVKS